MLADSVKSPTAVADRPAATIPWRQTTGVFLAGFAAFLPHFAPQSVLPQMADTLGASPAAAGAVIGATVLAIALGAPVAGPLVDRFGRKRAMLAAILMLVPLTLLLTFCQNLTQVLVVRFLQGLALPALFSGIVAYVNERWRGRDAANAMGYYVAGTAMGGFTGRFAAGSLAGPLGWQGGFTVLALISAAAGLLVWRWLPADVARPGGSLAQHVHAMFRHLRNPRITAACLVGAALLYSMTATLSYVSFHLAGPVFGLTSAGIGLIYLVHPIGAAIVPLNGRLLTRFGARGAVLCSLGICAVGEGLLLIPHVAAVAAGLATFVTGLFLGQSLALGYVGRTARESKGAAAGLYVCCFHFGGALGAVVPGLAWHAGGWTGCVMLVCLVLAAGACTVRWMQDDPA